MNNEGFDHINEEKQALISRNVIKLSNFLSNTGFYSWLKENAAYQTFGQEAAKHAANLLGQRLDKNFDKSSYFFQKAGFFISSSKLAEHQKSVGIWTGGTAFAITSAFKISPLLVDNFIKASSDKNLKIFVIGWLAYINKDSNPRIQRSVEQLCDNTKIQFKEQEYTTIFQEYSVSNAFPKYSSVPKESHRSLYNFITNISNVKESDIRERCEEFGEFLGLSRNIIQDIINNSDDNVEFISDYTAITGISYNTIMRDLAESWGQSQQYAYYSVSNDIYKARRDEIIRNLGNLTIGTVALIKPDIGNIVLESASAMFDSTLNDHLDFRRMKDIHNRMKTIGELLRKRSSK